MSKAERLIGRAVQIRVESSGSADRAAAPAAAVEHAPSKEPTGTAPPASQRGPGPELIAEARKEPGVQKLLREFGAQVVDIQSLGETPDPLPAELANERPPREES